MIYSEKQFCCCLRRASCILLQLTIIASCLASPQLLELVFEAVKLSDALHSNCAENKQLEDAAAGKVVTLTGWASCWWKLFDPQDGILRYFNPKTIILDGDKKASSTKEKVLKLLRVCHDKAEELRKVASNNLPAIIEKGSKLHRKYMAFVEQVKTAAKKKAAEDKRLQASMNAYEVHRGMQSGEQPTPTNFDLTQGRTMTPMSHNDPALSSGPTAGLVDCCPENDGYTPVVVGVVQGGKKRAPIATFSNYIPAGVKQTCWTAMKVRKMRALISRRGLI